MDHDFLRATWGMSRDDIKRTEVSELLADAMDTLVYRRDIASFPCRVIYHFVENKLWAGKYSFVQDHLQPTAFLNDFDQLKSLLKQKYGDPDNVHTFWNDDLFRDDPDQWGLAVSCGHMSMFANWKRPRTKICLALFGDNHEIDLTIEYTSTELESVAESKRSKQALEEL